MAREAGPGGDELGGDEPGGDAGVGGAGADAVADVLAAEGLRLVGTAPDGNCFLAAARVALAQVWGLREVPGPQVLRGMLAAALRGDAGHRAALEVQAQRALAEQRAADFVVAQQGGRARLVDDLRASWGESAEQAADRYIRSQMTEELIAQFTGPVTDAEWEHIAGDIETDFSWNNVAGDVTPVLFALFFGVKIVVVRGDGGRYPIVPSAVARSVVTGIPVRIFLVRTGDNHWDGSEPVGAPAGPQEGHGGQARGPAVGSCGGAGAGAGSAGDAGHRRAVAYLGNYLIEQHGTTDAAEAFFCQGVPGDSTAYEALMELLSPGTAPGRRGVLVAARTGRAGTGTRMWHSIRPRWCWCWCWCSQRRAGEARLTR